MLQSPLKKNKHSYPIDFYNRKKEHSRKPQKKYDIIAGQQNPQHNFSLKESSITQNKSLVSQLFLQSAKIGLNQNITALDQCKEKANSCEKVQNQKHDQNFFFQNSHESQQNEQPLKEVRKKVNHIIMDENLLKNPRIQFDEQKTIKTSQRTLQTLSPQILKKKKKCLEVGGIKHQDLKFYQQYQDQKQNPLLPQKPFDVLNKNFKRNSLLQRISMAKMKNFQIQQKTFDSYTNSQIRSGNKIFRPQTYTYANKLIPSVIEENVKRANSSFDIQKRQKIIYINSGSRNNFSFNIPDISSNISVDKFNKVNLHNTPIPRSKFLAHENVGKLLSARKNLSNFSHNANQATNQHSQRSQPKNFQITQQKQHSQPDQLTKLKNQINLSTQNRFRNRFYQNQKQRQFTFQNDQNKAVHDEQKRVSVKKNTKKLQITYHIPLSNLKSMCRRYLSNPEEYSMAFKVPKIFMEQGLFSRSQKKDELHQNALLLFQFLKISAKDMVIKRYSNCIMFITGHIVVIWYFNGKRYLGGWQYQYLDQGSRHGLGLEWEPNNHIYYGQFRKNKKHGLGAMKQGPQQVTIGYWSNGKYIGKAFRQENQEIESENQQSQNYERVEQSQLNQDFRNFDQANQYRG